MADFFIKIMDGTYAQGLTVGNALVIIISALVLGLIVSLTYLLTHIREGYSRSLPTTLIMLPAIIAIIVLLIGNNIARAFSLAGAFTIIRFRSAPSDPKDIAYVFFALAAGLACGIGTIGYGLIFVIVMCLVMIVLQAIGYGSQRRTVMTVKITVPEELNFKGAFDDILNKYTKHWFLKRIKTTDFGELFEITYRVDFKPDSDQKEFVDEIRTRNGNLTVALTVTEDDNILNWF